MAEFSLDLLDSAVRTGSRLSTRVLGEPNWNAGWTNATLDLPCGCHLGGTGPTQEEALVELAAMLAESIAAAMGHTCDPA